MLFLPTRYNRLLLLILYTYVLASFLSASVPKNVPADTLPVHESSLISVSDVIQSVAYSRVFKGNDNQSQERFLAIGILDYVEVQIASSVPVAINTSLGIFLSAPSLFALRLRFFAFSFLSYS